MKQVITGNSVNGKGRMAFRSVLPAIALGCSLGAAPVSALELGELTVASNLGQPLRASIAYALAPNEILSNACVSVSAFRATGGLPGIGSNSVSITERAIVITGETPIREPMLGTRITINCPHAPNLSREYMVFVDPAGIAETQTTLAPPPIARLQNNVRAAPAPTASPGKAAVVTPIGEATRYQVQPGDTLSEIVQRIDNRSMPMWQAVNAIVAANPEAFFDGDPDRLKAGSWLTIPGLDRTAPVLPPSEAVAEGEANPGHAISVDHAPEASTSTPGIEPAATYEPTAVDLPADPQVESELANGSTTELEIGDGVVDTIPAVPAEAIDVPDTQPEIARTAPSSPPIPEVTVSTDGQGESISMLMWLIGGGLAFIAALLLFGRRVLARFRPTPVEPDTAEPDSRQADETAEIVAIADDDIEADSPTEENPALDADFEIGTGLTAGVDMDVAQDFSYAATTELDFELPLEPEIPAAKGANTDIIPPIGSNIESILQDEILPEDDDYDLSVIMDATKMPQTDDVTERDLMAVPIDSRDDDKETGNFSVDEESDFGLLEQDYEDELSATRALNLRGK